MKASPLFELLSFNALFVLYTTVLSVIGCDNLFLSIGRNLVVHFKFFQNQIKNVNFQENRLKELILYQMEIKKCCSDFNKLYHDILFIQFMSFVIQICTLGYKIVKVISDFSRATPEPLCPCLFNLFNKYF